MRADLLTLASELVQKGEPFALATVVRCERPTSAKPGAKALIRPDGTLSGWIGGSCAEPLVVEEALAALRDGQPRLVALRGDGGGPPSGRTEGVREYAMPCHSGGTLEIYIEPVLPKPALLLVGQGPVVDTLARLAGAVDFEVSVVDHEAAAAEALARLAVTPETSVVVATHGRFDEEALDQALRSEAAYVSLVASPKRTGAVVEALRARGVPAERLGRLKAPAGLDVGALTPQEIAVSILAEIIQVRRRRPAALPRAGGAEVVSLAAAARDPVCGMTVEVAGARHTSEVAARPFYFCCAGCKQRFDRDPERYAAAARA